MIPAREPAALLEAAKRLFGEGRISDCWQRISPLTVPGTSERLPSSLLKDMQFLWLGCALYGQGDLEGARALNRRLPAEVLGPMRYRLSLRLHDLTTARTIRRHPANAGEKEQADFRTSLGLHLMWAKRYRVGLRLYHSRHAAINFPKILPDSARYVPLPDDPAQDENVIVLEQGLGEVLFQIAHIRAAGGHETSVFSGPLQFGPLVERYLPDARFLRPSQLSKDRSQPVPAHLGMDFIERSHARSGRISPGVALDTPVRHAFDAPVFGICWRGGSGQNRREERNIPLPFLLDALPLGVRLLSLQPELTEEETKILHADPRCSVPLRDLRRNPAETMQIVRSLAGVIGVDSANWHMAGFSGVPLLAIMNRSSHWFWGAGADVASVFPSATTLPKRQLSAPVLAEWIGEAEEEWRQRPISPLADPEQRLRRPDRPLFICGIPRSGTSMVTRIFAAHGLWLGDTIPGNADNPQGFYENRALREEVLKPILAHLGADPRGVSPLPRLDTLPPMPGLADQIRSIIDDEGYNGSGIWGYKDPKLSLLWPVYARAFPGAHWLIVRRSREKVLQSLIRASFMRRISASTEFWEPFCTAYDDRLEALRQSDLRVSVADADAIMAGDFTSLEPAFASIGLTISPGMARVATSRSSGKT